MKNLNNLFKPFFILSLLFAVTACEGEDITGELPVLTAGFTYDANQGTGTVIFENTSVNATNYSWTFGDGETSTEKNPIKSYTTGSYTVSLTASNNAGAMETVEEELIINITDLQVPVITLIGDATINVTVGNAYTDQGATATDDVDGDITANIVVVNPVDVDTEGTYTITYNVSDAAGNAATEVTRTVIVAAASNNADGYLFATSETVNLTSSIEDWGSGTTIVTDYSSDATYNPCIQLTSGTAWGDAFALAFTGLQTGLLSNYTTLKFKVKSSDFTSIRVKVPENELVFNFSEGTALANGWVQMSLPLSNWSAETAAANQFAILEFGAGTLLITDIMLSNN